MKILQNISDRASKKVRPIHVWKVKRAAKKMIELCNKPLGNWGLGGVALAHNQVDQKNPLRFYVTREGQVYCNPVIVDHTETPKWEEEGCMSFADRRLKQVQRYYKVEMMYQPIEDGSLGEPTKVSLKGLEAQIAQHELDHLQGVHLYN